MLRGEMPYTPIIGASELEVPRPGHFQLSR